VKGKVAPVLNQAPRLEGPVNFDFKLSLIYERENSVFLHICEKNL
jgi:hypothetical protein